MVLDIDMEMHMSMDMDFVPEMDTDANMYKINALAI